MPFVPDNLFKAWHDALQCKIYDGVSGAPKPIAVYIDAMFRDYRKDDPTPEMDPAARWLFNPGEE
jgi:hypothetical protein